MSGKKLLLISVLVILILAIPVTIYIIQQQQQTKSHATASTTLAFSPSTATKNINDTITLSININPGSNLVSFVSLDITYDPTKFEPVDNNALTIDKSVLPIILQGPVYSTGRIRINLSTGNDPTAAIKAPATIGTLTMKAIGGTGGTASPIAFGSSTQILSVAGPSTGSNDSAGENVLSTTTPAQITVADGTASVTPTTVAVGPTDTLTPTIPQSQPTTAVATVTPTKIPTPTIAASTPTVAPTLIAQANTPTPTVAAATPTTVAANPTTVPATPTNSAATNAGSAVATGTPTPTLAATGPGLTFVGIAGLFIIFIIGGGLLFFAL